MKEFLDEIKLNWNNGYWWADHQWLLYILLAGFASATGVVQKYIEIQMENKLKAGGA